MTLSMTIDGLILQIQFLANQRARKLLLCQRVVNNALSISFMRSIRGSDAQQICDSIDNVAIYAPFICSHRTLISVFVFVLSGPASICNLCLE